jgi:hypothetical protein
MALNGALPWVRDGLRDQVAIGGPGTIGSAGEQVGDFAPSLPPARLRRHKPRRKPSGDRYLELFPVFDSTYEI